MTPTLISMIIINSHPEVVEAQEAGDVAIPCVNASHNVTFTVKTPDTQPKTTALPRRPKKKWRSKDCNTLKSYSE